MTQPRRDRFLLTRRQLLRGLGAAMSASALPACGSGSTLDADDVLPDTAADLAQVARIYFGDQLEPARNIGEAYLLGFDSAREARRDLERCFDPLADISSAEQVATELESALMADFEIAVVESLAGWQLGLTELRVAAVARLAT